MNENTTERCCLWRRSVGRSGLFLYRSPETQAIMALAWVGEKHGGSWQAYDNHDEVTYLGLSCLSTCSSMNEWYDSMKTLCSLLSQGEKLQEEWTTAPPTTINTSKWWACEWWVGKISTGMNWLTIYIFALNSRTWLWEGEKNDNRQLICGTQQSWQRSSVSK